VRQYTEAERAHPQSAALRSCSGSYKELNLETIQVDLRYGLLLDQRTDFLIGDKFPLELTRVVRTQDERSRAFGVGGSHSLNLFLVGDKWPFTTMDLVLPDGGRAHFKRANWGFGYWDARYQNRDANWSKFAYSKISWAWPGWKLEKGIDVYQFPDRPDATRPEQTALVSIQHGKIADLVLAREANGNIRRAVSGTNELVFSNDENGRVRKIQEHDQPLNQFQYEYEPGGHLSRVTDPRGNITEYGYDRSHLVSIKENNTVVSTFEYDSSDRVRKEMLDGRVYEFRYQSGFRGQVGTVTILDSAGPTRVVRITGNEYSLDTIANPKVIKQDTQK
jgi:YD repeat-containing protein